MRIWAIFAKLRSSSFLFSMQIFFWQSICTIIGHIHFTSLRKVMAFFPRYNKMWNNSHNSMTRCSHTHDNDNYAHFCLHFHGNKELFSRCPPVAIFCRTAIDVKRFSQNLIFQVLSLLVVMGKVFECFPSVWKRNSIATTNECWWSNTTATIKNIGYYTSANNSTTIHCPINYNIPTCYSVAHYHASPFRNLIKWKT